MTDAKRDCVSRWIVRLALLGMVGGFVADVSARQSQDAINATLTERMRSGDARLDSMERHVESIDSKLWAGLAGIVALLAERGFQLRKGR